MCQKLVIKGIAKEPLCSFSVGISSLPYHSLKDSAKIIKGSVIPRASSQAGASQQEKVLSICGIYKRTIVAVVTKTMIGIWKETLLICV